MTNTKAMELNEREMENVNGGYGYGYGSSPISDAMKKIEEYLDSIPEEVKKNHPYFQDGRPECLKHIRTDFDRPVGEIIMTPEELEKLIHRNRT